VLIASVVFLGAFGVALVPEAFDRPVTALINSFAGRSPLFDSLVAALDYHTFSGVLLMSFVWASWFDTKDPESRARILVGTLAAFAAGVISRLMQRTLSTHPRPYYDPALGFHRPLELEVPYNTWNSFPSDHVAVFIGLVVVLYIARSRFAVFAIGWTILVEANRTYLGGHYPSDLVGAAALSVMVVWSAQARWLISAGVKVTKWEQSSPSLFYLGAFFVSYQIATLIVDIRNVAILLRHAW